MMSTGRPREQGDAAPMGSERHMRPTRCDRERILEAATTLMAVHGIDVPIDDIADLAQVGVGTVYRTSRPGGSLRGAPAGPDHAARGRGESCGGCRRAWRGVRCLRAQPVRRVRRISRRSRMRWSNRVDLSATKSQISGELIDAVSLLLERAQVSGRIRPDVNIRTSQPCGRPQSRRPDDSWIHRSASGALRWCVIRCWSAFAARSRSARWVHPRRILSGRALGPLIFQASRSMARCLPIWNLQRSISPADRTSRSISHVPRSSRESRTSSTRMTACPSATPHHRPRRSTILSWSPARARGLQLASDRSGLGAAIETVRARAARSGAPI